MGASTDRALKAEVESFVTAEMQRVGLDAFRASVVYRRFADRGTSRSTIYAWIDRQIASGRPAEELRATIRKRAAQAVAPPGDPKVSAASEVIARLPKPVRPEDVASTGLVGVMDLLRECQETARQVMKHSRAQDGTVRNGKMLLAASEHLRRTIDTAGRLAETVNNAAAIERFHRVLIGEIEKESPELAQRVVIRLEQFLNHWDG